MPATPLTPPGVTRFDKVQAEAFLNGEGETLALVEAQATIAALGIADASISDAVDLQATIDKVDVIIAALKAAKIIASS